MSPQDTAGPPRRSRGARCGRSCQRLLGRGLRSTALLLAILLSAACSDLTGIEEIRVEIDPPAGHEVLWSQLQACSGQQGEFARVRWFWIPRFPDDTRVLGQWNGRHEITLSSAVWSNRVVVAHEMLHDLLEGDREHRDAAWETCGVPTGEG